MLLNNLTTENDKFWFPQTLWISCNCKDFFSRFFANFRGESQEGGKGTEIIVFDKKKIMKILVGLTKKSNNMAPNCTCIFGNAVKVG